MFKVGQKVVCVDDSTPLGYWAMDLVKGRIYTVRELGLRSHIDGTPCLRVEETNREGSDVPYWYRRFRPIVERKTDISIFKKMLTPRELERVKDTRNSVSFKSFATKDGAEPSIARSSGAIPGGSTDAARLFGHSSAMVRVVPRVIRDGRAASAGPNQDRRRSDDRSCTRTWPTSSAENHNCERQQVRCRNAPRGVVEAALAGRVATEARHSFSGSAA